MLGLQHTDVQVVCCRCWFVVVSVARAVAVALDVADSLVFLCVCKFCSSLVSFEKIRQTSSLSQLSLEYVLFSVTHCQSCVIIVDAICLLLLFFGGSGFADLNLLAYLHACSNRNLVNEPEAVRALSLSMIQFL